MYQLEGWNTVHEELKLDNIDLEYKQKAIVYTEDIIYEFNDLELKNHPFNVETVYNQVHIYSRKDKENFFVLDASTDEIYHNAFPEQKISYNISQGYTNIKMAMIEIRKMIFMDYINTGNPLPYFIEDLFIVDKIC